MNYMQSLELIQNALYQYLSILSEFQDHTAVFFSLLASVYMFAVIWIIQMIHYPSFVFINPNHFVKFHIKHTMAMSVLVGPIMILELLFGIWLVYFQLDLLSILNLILIIILWILTFLVSVPIHQKISNQFDIKLIDQLILTNWPRTVIWTLKLGLIVFWYIKI